MKKIKVFSLALVMMLSVGSLNVFATDFVEDNTLVETQVVNTNGETVSMVDFKNLEDNKILELNNNYNEQYVTYTDSVVKVNGLDAIHIDEIIEAPIGDGGTIQPYASLGDYEYSPYPSSSYTDWRGKTSHTTRLQQGIVAMGQALLGIAIQVAIPIPALSTKLASVIIAGAIATVFAGSTVLYYTKSVYYHRSLGSMAQEIYVSYFYDSNHSSSAGSTIYYRLYM